MKLVNSLQLTEAYKQICRYKAMQQADINRPTTFVVDGWVVTINTARRGLDGWALRCRIESHYSP